MPPRGARTKGKAIHGDTIGGSRDEVNIGGDSDCNTKATSLVVSPLYILGGYKGGNNGQSNKGARNRTTPTRAWI